MEEEAGQLCVRCKEKPAVYKCPGCNRRTCSATCSTEHKEVFSCSGKRNKAAYVPLNKYTWGSMMDDYTYLEDCGRQISEWGKTIAAQRLPAPPKSKHGKLKHQQHRRSSKREIFQAHLASMNIHMELAPLGMQRQALNRSNMKAKSDSVTLTIEYVFHNPADSGKYELITHMNPMDQTLRTLLTTKLREGKADKHPPWVVQLAAAQKDGSPKIVFFMKSITNEPGVPFEYRLLDVDQPFSQALQGTTFVEFPRIEVYEASDAPSSQTSWKRRAAVVADAPAQKRPRLDVQERKPHVMQGLAQYGSDSEGPEHDVVPRDGKEIRSILNVLGDYSDGSSGSEAEEANYLPS